MPWYRRGLTHAAIAGLVVALAPLLTAPNGSEPAAAETLASAPPVTKQRRPNIVVIMADDMRLDDLRWMPKTRRLIGARGARFTNSFAPYPLCCPARASFLTGRYTHNHGVWSTRKPYAFHSFRDRRTLPVWLRRSGYRTLFLGKYLNKYGVQRTPGGKPSLHYVPPGWTEWRASIDGGLRRDHPLAGGSYRYFDTTLNVNGRLQGHQGQYQTQMLGRQSSRLVRKYAKGDRPFFLWASYVAPHHGRPIEPDDPRPVKRNDGTRIRIVTPAVPDGVRGRFNDEITRPPGFPTERDVSDKPSFIRRQPAINRRERRAILEATRQRAESLAVLDTQVARTVRALRGTGELKRTLVMFTSDNGYFLGEHRKRQGKLTPYEPALRTPLLMRGPGIPAGVTRRPPFLSIDFAPTILRAAKARIRPSIDGRSLLEVARSGRGHWQRAVLTEALYVPKRPKGHDWLKSVGVRTPGFYFARHSTGEAELYDMRRDPGQLRNVADAPRYANERSQLARILRDIRDCDGRECRRPLSSW